jgi:FlaA1/EpsC-like NDP-sugar epimerase
MTEYTTPPPNLRLTAARSAHGDIDYIVTRRRESFFRSDLNARSSDISAQLKGRRVLVVGGGGSIGSATTCLLVNYAPSAIHVIDQNENYLVELVRYLRGRPHGLPSIDFRTLPIDYGNPIMERFLREADKPYEIVLNFAALKHVRSEKDIYSVLQILDTNLVRHARFKHWLSKYGHGRLYFAVSTDKAANPTSLMGASKRLMEDLTFGLYAAEAQLTTSARFANVSFSNGSLLDGFLRRLATRQPLAAPRDTRRYFISQIEAGELCLIAALLPPDKHVVFPNLNPLEELQPLESIAVRVLEHFGLTPQFYEEEESARRDLERVARSGRWPLLLTPLDTSGEKSYEEFVGEGETAVDIGMKAIRAFRHVPSRAIDNNLFDRMAPLIDNPHIPVNINRIVEEVSQALASFCHVDTGKNLDQRF